MDTLKHLETKIVDSQSFRDAIRLVYEGLADDVEPLFLKSLDRINKIIFAKAFTRYGWLLAIYSALGKVEGDTLIIYYNSEEPKWTASTLIHEAIHVALDINRQDLLDIIVDEALAYTASFKSGFQNLYLEGVKQAMEILSTCTNPYEDHELTNTIIPRILAHRLTKYNYTQLVEKVVEKPKAILNLWLDTNPEKNEIQALATALKIARIDIENSLLETGCREESSTLYNTNKYSYELEGVDKDFLKMIELLNEAAKNRQKAHQILRPWWNELKEIEQELEAYLYTYSQA